MIHFPRCCFHDILLLLKTLPFASLSSLSITGHQALRWCPCILATLFSGHQCGSLASLRRFSFFFNFNCQMPLVPFCPFTWGVFSQPNPVHSPRLSSGFVLPSWSHEVLAHTASPAALHPSRTTSPTHFGYLVDWVLYWSCVFSHTACFPSKLKPLSRVDSALFILYITTPSKSQHTGRVH